MQSVLQLNDLSMRCVDAANAGPAADKRCVAGGRGRSYGQLPAEQELVAFEPCS